jgi:ATP-dependent Clp protease ATP-binding subunit ClpA
LREALEAGLRLCATTPAVAPTFYDPRLQRRLHMVGVSEPTIEEMRDSILPAVARYLEVRHGLTIPSQTLELALSMSRRRPGAQPGRTLRILEEALTRIRGRQLTVLGPDDLFADA